MQRPIMDFCGHQKSTIPLSSFHVCLSKKIRIPPYHHGTFYLLVKKSSKLHRTVQKFSTFSSKRRQSPVRKTSKSHRTVMELFICLSKNLQNSTVPFRSFQFFRQHNVKVLSKRRQNPTVPLGNF